MHQNHRPFELAGSELGAALTAVGWQGRLERAIKVTEVLEVVRDYLALWSPEEIAQLPADCRPGKIVDPDDVSQLAVQLARTTLDRSTDPAASLAKLSEFVASACTRMSRILAVAEHAG